MKGYNEIADAKRLVEQYGPEVAQEIIASYMRDRGMQEGVDMLAGVDVRKAQRSLKPADLSDGMAGAPQAAVGDDAGLSGPYSGAGRPGYDRTFTNEELLAQRGMRVSHRRRPATQRPARVRWTADHRKRRSLLARRKMWRRTLVASEIREGRSTTRPSKTLIWVRVA